MLVSKASGEIKRFQRQAWSFQQTVRTPLKDLPHFVSRILEPFPLKSASLTIAEVVFEPKHLRDLLASHSVLTQSCRDLTLTATDRAEIAPLLEAALGDWVDFLFVPVPGALAIYADHDEYTTFFTRKKENLTRLSSSLIEHGFIPEYTRNF
jgi:hypothetical protein